MTCPLSIVIFAVILTDILCCNALRFNLRASIFQKFPGHHPPDPSISMLHVLIVHTITHSYSHKGPILTACVPDRFRGLSYALLPGGSYCLPPCSILLHLILIPLPMQSPVTSPMHAGSHAHRASSYAVHHPPIS